MTQSFRDYELIIVNDGSTDNSLMIMGKYEESDDRVHVFNKKNEGVNIARKTGVEYAKGEWILFIDSDDELTENSIAAMYSYARNDVDMIVGSLMDYSFFRKTRYNLYSYEEKNYLQYTRDLIRNKIHKGPFARLIRKSLFDSSTFDMPLIITIAEDYIMNLRLGQKCRKIILIPDIVYRYIHRPESAISKRRYNRDYERILMHTLCLSILPENKKLVKTVIIWQKWWEIKLIIKSLIIWIKKILKNNVIGNEQGIEQIL